MQAVDAFGREPFEGEGARARGCGFAGLSAGLVLKRVRHDLARGVEHAQVAGVAAHDAAVHRRGKVELVAVGTAVGLDGKAPGKVGSFSAAGTGVLISVSE